MPADRSYFNQHNHHTARGSLLVPYPSAEEAFRWSNSHAPTNDFSTLGLSDFFIAHRRVARHRLDHLSLSGNTQELLSRGVGVNLERREPYDPILEASIGYAGAAAVAVMDEVAFVNERQDERMEGIEEGALSLVSRVASLEEENRQLREVQWAQEERVSRDGERIWDLERTTGTLRTLINSLVETVGLVQNDVARIHHRFVNNRVNRRAERRPDQVQMLVEHEGRLIPIEEPIDLAERRPTPHPSQIIDLTDDSDEVMPVSSGSSIGSVRDFGAEEEEQARNEEGETIEAEVRRAMADPAPEYLPPYEDPPGIDHPFVSE